MPSAKPRVLLADDHDDVLEQISTILADDYEIVGTARDGLALLRVAANLRPDVVVTDYKMPGLDGIQAARKLLQSQSCQAVVLLTLHDEQHLMEAALAVGIRSYVLKSNAAQDLGLAIRAALEGSSFVRTDWHQSGPTSPRCLPDGACRALDH
jgi:DNA-binding NarL/FixJ family response regulator